MEDFDAQTPSQPESRHTKRRLILGLISLHVAALLAAAVLVVRFKNEGTKSDADKVGKSLLTLDRRDSIGWVSIRGPIYASESGRPWDRGAEQWARRIEQLAETKGGKKKWRCVKL
jgi:hypothetical protein